MLCVRHPGNDLTLWKKIDNLLENHPETFVRYADNQNNIYVLYNLDSDADSLYLVMLILVFLSLAVAAMSGIGNALMANAKKRRQEMGLLRAIGATGKQARGVLLTKALVLAALAVPLGVVLSVGLMHVAKMAYPDFIIVWTHLWLVAADVLACFACVTLCSWLPTRRVLRISPMQAVRDVGRTSAFLQKGIKSQKSFRPHLLFAKRANALQKGKTRGAVIMIAAGCLLFSIGSLFCTNILMNMREGAARNSYDYKIYAPSYVSSGFEDWKLGFANAGYTLGQFTSADADEVGQVPYVTDTRVRKSVSTVLLLDEASDYITAEWRTDEFDYLTAEETPMDLLQEELYTIKGYTTENTIQYSYNDENERKRTNALYNKQMEAFGWQGKTGISASLIGMDMQSLMELAPRVYAGKLNPEKLLSGEEVIVVAHKEYAVNLAIEQFGGNTNLYYVNSGFCTGKNIKSEYGRVYTNDTFRPGDTIDIATVVTYDEDVQEYKITRKQATIGAVVEDDWSINSPFCTFGVVLPDSVFTWFSPVDIVEEIRISCGKMPSETVREAVADELSLIAQRWSSMSLIDYTAIAERTRSEFMLFTAGSAAILLLLFCLTYAMCTGTLSAKIQVETAQIGTMRAIGASRRVITKSYAGQITRMLLPAIAIAYPLFGGVLLLIRMDFSRYSVGAILFMFSCAPGYCLLLWLLCRLFVRIRIRLIFEKSVVENIRVL